MAMLSKVCEICGRTFEWRKKWEKNWEAIKYCSDQCRKKSRLTKSRPDYAPLILNLLQSRAKGQTICPSEILEINDPNLKSNMEEVRQSARLLAHKGLIEITQKGQVVNPDNFRGPIRLRLKLTR